MKVQAPFGTARETKSRGFTLIELLTVIAIIGILAAIIIPTVGAVRTTARGTKCLSQVRQLGVAYLLYANENKGVLLARGDPAASNTLWNAVLGTRGYVPKQSVLNTTDGIWFCPESKQTTGVVSTSPTTSYGVCTWMGPAGGSDITNTKFTTSSIPSPSRTWMIGEATRYGSPTDMSNGWYAVMMPTGSGFPVPDGSGVALPGTRHKDNTKANVCMFDGHVQSLTRDDLNTKDGTNFRYFTYK